VSKNIYVGNLPWSADDAALSEMFSDHGEVISARVITDRDTGRSRGFGFVEMDEASADAAINALNGKDMGGRPLKVNEAQPRRDNNNRRSNNRW